MRLEPTPLAGSFLIHLEPKVDERGSFTRTFCVRELAAAGVEMRVVQANESRSREKFTLRGMHYQVAPYAEIKIVSCAAGSVFDVIVDVRRDSPTLGKYFATTLRAGDDRLLLVPHGFAHGFLTLEDNSCVRYLVSEYYAPDAECGLRWDDPAVGIRWPHNPRIVSARDHGYALIEEIGWQ
jgi:dTDP-4-dehydrorhamnose 3,5-epimerase